LLQVQVVVEELQGVQGLVVMKLTLRLQKLASLEIFPIVR
jgi:hypothetical protein